MQQVKLLRLLQDGVYEALGSTKTERADVRVIAATNADLRAEVAAGRFRQDLYFRLAIYPLRVPSLRERTDDIGALAALFLRDANARHRLAVAGFKPAAAQALSTHDWPGNVRELEHVVTRAAIRCSQGEIDARDLALEPTARDDRSHALGELERDAVERALTQCGGNVSQAAVALGISRQSLYRRLEKHRLLR